MAAKLWVQVYRDGGLEPEHTEPCADFDEALLFEPWPQQLGRGDDVGSMRKLGRLRQPGADDAGEVERVDNTLEPLCGSRSSACPCCSRRPRASRCAGISTCPPPRSG
jgi:hypothetical protein